MGNAMSEKAYAEIVRQNARRWEAMASYRQGMPVEDHRAGVSALEPEEWELLGNLNGKRVLHLACAVCDEGISMAIAGAHVVGIDISETHIRQGRAKVDALGLDVELKVGDMMHLDSDLGGFDVVYISSGGICWVPDLDDWLAGVSKVLKPGGFLLVAEHHPFWESMGVAGERTLTILHDYFARRELPSIRDDSKAAIGVAQTAGRDDELQSFIWSIGAVVSAMIRNGFQIAALVELPYPDMFRELGEAADCVPAVYLLKGTRLD